MDLRKSALYFLGILVLLNSMTDGSTFITPSIPLPPKIRLFFVPKFTASWGFWSVHLFEMFGDCIYHVLHWLILHYRVRLRCKNNFCVLEAIIISFKCYFNPQFDHSNCLIVKVFNDFVKCFNFLQRNPNFYELPP